MENTYLHSLLTKSGVSARLILTETHKRWFTDFDVSMDYIRYIMRSNTLCK